MLSWKEARRQAELSAKFNRDIGIKPQVGYEWDAGQIPYFVLKGGGRITVKKVVGDTGMEVWQVYLKEYLTGREYVLKEFAEDTLEAEIEAKTEALLIANSYYEGAKVEVIR